MLHRHRRILARQAGVLHQAATEDALCRSRGAARGARRVGSSPGNRSTNVSRRGKLLLYAKPIHLNDQSRAEELGDYIQKREIQFLVIDTFRR